MSKLTRYSLLFLSLYLEFSLTILVLAQQTDPYHFFCDPNFNYTRNTNFEGNLDRAFADLPLTNSGYGFFNSSSRQDSDAASATALCRGDIESIPCGSCVNKAILNLRQVCPNQKDGSFFYENCSVTYSDGYLWGSSNANYPITDWRADNVTDDVPSFTQDLLNLIRNLTVRAAAGGALLKYASGTMTRPNSEVTYALVQCTPDLSEQQCTNCLQYTVSQMVRQVSGSIGVQVYLPKCNMRYEDYRFYNDLRLPENRESPNSFAESPSSFAESPSSKSTSLGVIVGPIIAVAVIFVIVVFILQRRQKQKRKGPLLPEVEVGFSDILLEGSLHQREDNDTGEMNDFNLGKIQIATNNFSLENKLGEGGFGPVYKGILHDGKEVAVKRLSRNSGQGLVEFKTEVQLIIKLQHKNLVRLLGYCVKGCERLLIYEFMANNSLDTFLFDANKCEEVDWAMRTNIVIGIAKGLRYLHEDSRLKIIHRDMKASNVLLDNEMNPKISDFGTARIFGGNQMEAATNRIVGTYGYMAPEYAMEGLFSTKSDVYSFGVLLLEIVAGQRNNRFSYQGQPQNFLSTAFQLWKENKAEQMIDSRIIQNILIDEALRWINIALLCVQEDPNDRPTMSTVVFMLEGQWTTILPAPAEPPVSFARFAAVFSEQTTTMGHQTEHITASGTSFVTASRSTVS